LLQCRGWCFEEIQETHSRRQTAAEKDAIPFLNTSGERFNAFVLAEEDSLPQKPQPNG